MSSVPTVRGRTTFTLPVWVQALLPRSEPPLASLQVGMFKIHPEIPESMSLEAKAFILRCFEPDPDRRATALDLLTDEFLTVTSRKKKSKGSFTGGAACSPGSDPAVLRLPAAASRKPRISSTLFHKHLNLIHT